MWVNSILERLKAMNFDELVDVIRYEFITKGQVVDVGEWQSITKEDADIPMQSTYELEGVSFRWEDVPSDIRELQYQVKPNLPWAENHFKERVGGKPLNPGNEYKNWPWYKQGVEDHKEEGDEGLFSHTYMERYWPRYASPLSKDRVRMGIRYEYGDLTSLESLLLERPNTRQAYLPIWFPEDLAAAQEYGERVPCSLGYHFLLRNGKLNVTYFMRSCDWFRYFRDDVYMTCRLLQRIAHKMGVPPGNFTMHISSLHIFEAEISRLQGNIK